MIEKIINPYNLKDDMIENEISRVKILPITLSNQILLCKVNGIYHFIGGHINSDETPIECLKRELLEETGISINIETVSPFLLLKRYSANYFGTNKKCLLNIYYYKVYINDEFDLSKQTLDDDEKNNNFSLEYVDFDTVEDHLLKNTNKDKLVLLQEMIDAINICKNYPNDDFSSKKKRLI